MRLSWGIFGMRDGDTTDTSDAIELTGLDTSFLQSAFQSRKMAEMSRSLPGKKLIKYVYQKAGNSAVRMLKNDVIQHIAKVIAGRSDYGMVYPSKLADLPCAYTPRALQ